MGAFVIQIIEFSGGVDRELDENVRKRGDGSRTDVVVRDPRVHAVPCAVPEAPAPARLHPAARSWCLSEVE